MDFIEKFFPVILIFIVFSLPELLKSRKKNKNHYEYPQVPVSLPEKEEYSNNNEIVSFNKYEDAGLVSSKTDNNQDMYEINDKLNKKTKIKKSRVVSALVMGELIAIPRARCRTSKQGYRR